MANVKKCLNPTQAWICGKMVTKDGLISDRLVFKSTEATHYYERLGMPHMMEHNSIEVPCGHCIHCLVNKRKDMSTRLALEARCHDECFFLTLTYNEDHVPITDTLPLDNPLKVCEFGYKAADKSIAKSVQVRTLVPRDVQLFLKRLRRYLEYHHGKKIRYYACGEYGSRTQRPHYHLLIFGWKPTDLKFQSKNGKVVNYISDVIAKKWKYGYHLISDVNPSVARYCAQYVTKKLTARTFRNDRMPEFCTMSTRQGSMGALWFERYGADALRKGFTTLEGYHGIYKVKIPKYFLSRCRKCNVPLFLEVRAMRKEFAKAHKCESASLEEVYASASFEMDKLRLEAEKERLPDEKD